MKGMMGMTDEDKIKRIALETADHYAQRTEKKIGNLAEHVDDKVEGLHGRVTDLATEVKAVKTRVSMLPDKGALLEEIRKCKAEHAAQARLTFAQWFKIITLILGFVAAAWGVDFVVPDMPSPVAQSAKP